MTNLQEQPWVSLVVPAYNHASYLPQAIDSLLAQDYPGLEVIVLDDGSTDDTAAVLARYDGRIRWESHANMGQAATLNKGWTMARGELLGYLSADDFLLPGAVTALVGALAGRPDAQVVYCDFELVDPAGRTVRRVRAADFSLDDMLTRLACPPGPGALFRRTAFEKAGGWNPALRQMPDFDFWLRVALHGPFVRIDRPLAAWRVHEASQSFGATTPARAEEPVRIMEAIFADPAMDPARRQLRPRGVARAHLVCAQLHARSGRYARALAEFGKACRMRPAFLLRPDTWRIVLNALVQRPAHQLLWNLRALIGRPARR